MSVALQIDLPESIFAVFHQNKQELANTFKLCGLCCTNQICSKPPQPQNSFML